MAKRTTRLMVLGVIAYRQPIGGYGIQKVFDQWAIERWTTVAPASIYQQLTRLSGAGQIEVVKSAGGGRATTYRATPSGEAELRRLLLDLLNESDVRPLSLTPLLYFLPSLTRQELLDGVSARIDRLRRHVDVALDMERRAAEMGPAHVVEMFRLGRHAYIADLDWCRELLAALRRGDYVLAEQ